MDGEEWLWQTKKNATTLSGNGLHLRISATLEVALELQNGTGRGKHDTSDSHRCLCSDAVVYYFDMWRLICLVEMNLRCFALQTNKALCTEDAQSFMR